MWNNIVCRHYDVDWLDSHRCQCQGCGKYGHFFEEGYRMWTRAAHRPKDGFQFELAKSSTEPARKAS